MQSLLNFAGTNGLLGIAIIFTVGMLVGLIVMFIVYQD